MIESFIEGRVRLRSSLLADAALAEQLRSGLLGIEGVHKAEVNPRTHGLLLEYDKTRLPLPLLVRATPIFDALGGLTRLPAPERFAALEGLLSELRKLLSP